MIPRSCWACPPAEDFDGPLCSWCMDSVLVWKPAEAEQGSWPWQASHRESYTVPTIPTLTVPTSAGAVQPAML